MSKTANEYQKERKARFKAAALVLEEVLQPMLEDHPEIATALAVIKGERQPGDRLRTKFETVFQGQTSVASLDIFDRCGYGMSEMKRLIKAWREASIADVTYDVDTKTYVVTTDHQ